VAGESRTDFSRPFESFQLKSGILPAARRRAVAARNRLADIDNLRENIDVIL
jgi:hypothetical protein